MGLLLALLFVWPLLCGELGSRNAVGIGGNCLTAVVNSNAGGGVSALGCGGGDGDLGGGND